MTAIDVRLFSLLEDQHRRAQRLSTELLEATLAGSRSKQRELRDQLVHELAVHEDAEERHLWPRARALIAPSKMGLIDKARDQETTLKELLKELRKTDVGTTEFEGAIRSLSSLVAEHVTAEESQLFPKLLEAMGPDKQHEVASLIEAAQRVGPTRPHTPLGERRLLRRLGPALAALDRTRDLLRRA